MISKVTELSTAIKSALQPGMTIHLSVEAGAAARAIAAQFWSSQPAFTLIMYMVGGHHALSLIHGGLVKKLIFATCADIYPRPHPNPVIQRAYKNKSVELENWSMLSMTQALMAGALNLPFVTTNSVLGSHMADDNHQAIKVIDDVFGSGRKVGLVKALNPDVSIIHGLAADAQGNTIMAVPPRDGWAAKASKNGIIVTVEHLVSEDFIRKNSSLVKIPGNLVVAVCPTPLGAHPLNLNSPNSLELEGYGLDSDFLAEYRQASNSHESMEKWITEWITHCPAHRDYVHKLGPNRISHLKNKVKSVNSQAGLIAIEKGKSNQKSASATEYAIIGAARKIKDVVLKNAYRTMFAGIGISGLAGWCAYYFLKNHDYHIDLLAAGIGYQPCPGDPLLISPANIATAKMISDSIDLHGVGVGGINSACLGVLGAGQIDKNGNINSTVIRTRDKGDIYLAGAGGGNDIASSAKEVMVVSVYKKNRFVDQVHYITCPGDRVGILATDDGIFVKDHFEFVLKDYFPSFSLNETARIEEIKGHCGWNLRISPDLRPLSPPTAEELDLLRSFDPEGVFLE